MKKTIEQVLKEHTERLMSLAGVHGTGLGSCEGTPCIKVFVAKLPEESREKIPGQIEGYPVKIEQSGPFHAY